MNRDVVHGIYVKGGHLIISILDPPAQDTNIECLSERVITSKYSKYNKMEPSHPEVEI